MRNAFIKKVDNDMVEKENFKNDFNEKLESSESLGFNEDYLNLEDSDKPNDKMLQFDVIEDDDPIIRLLKEVVNDKKIKIQDFIDRYGHNSGNNLINSLKHRKNLQGRSRKKITKLLDSVFIVGVLDKEEYLKTSDGDVFVIVDEKELIDKKVNYKKVKIEMDVT